MKRFLIEINGKKYGYDNTYLNSLSAAEHEKKIVTALPDLAKEDFQTRKDYISTSDYNLETMKENFKFVATMTGAKNADLQKASLAEIRDAASSISSKLLELDLDVDDGDEDKDSKK
ncbi:hypothetical protein N6G95_09400 [Pediococcus inopinatus]|uniref:hypothetical protein n=1 Tax=Pediococcus inopinatus TaxID=114090 RepID=UPI002B25DE52|nr:hypothetical protein [Pediococcus inopinatus]WPC19420.1 hypothetical protein N6G95_09400 [Pediococcus inopinatus]